MAIFGDDLGLEVQANTLKRGSNIHNDTIEQVFVNAQIIKLAKKFNVRCVATANSHYLKKEDAPVHDVLLAIGSHQTVYSNFRLKYDCPEFYLKSGDEVKSFFERNYGDFAEQLCSNSIYFADKCEQPDWIDPKFSNPSGKELPTFPVQDEPDYQEFLSWRNEQTDEIKSLDEDKAFLRYKCEIAFEKSKISPEKIQEYRDRLEEELDTIYYTGISSYMLITADFLSWARNNDISVGFGRGSIGGCYVGYLLNIHQADPIQYDLVFARFFNKLKNDYSDIDNDISKANRGKLIQYIIKKYGEENVSQVSNVINMTPKVYVKDVARACEFGGSKEQAVVIGNAIADCISADIKHMDDAFEKIPLIAEYANVYPQLLKYKEIADKPRNVGCHAAAVIIGQRPLHSIVPMRRDKDGDYITEYDKVLIEENGLVKIDILGLNTLDIIDNALSLIKEAGKPLPKIDCDKYDQKTYDLISSGNTFGIFQFGTSAGTIDLCKKIQPKSIEDLAVITTLARPASKEIRDAFIKTKNGKMPINLLHPKLERAFSKTFGFPLYDESLLILAKDVAGWDLAEADKLRKLTKEKGKNPAKVKKWRQEFIDGSILNGLKQEDAIKIWTDIIEPFGKYSFNKSHAVLYSMVSYQTAYLKAHYPVEFLLANLMAEIKSNAPDAKNNIDKIKKEIRQQKVKIIKPDINKSALRYNLEETDKLVTGLDALKFVSDDAINDIISKRPFRNFQDFMARVDSRKVRANTIQALTASGCLDSFNISRKNIFLYCSDYRKKLKVWLKKHDSETQEFNYPWKDDSEWSMPELFALEKKYVGEAFICGKSKAYGDFFKVPHVTLDKIKKEDDKNQIKELRVEVKDMFEFKIKKADSRYYGQSMIKAVVEDINGKQSSMTIFPRGWTEIQERIKSVTKGKFKFEIGCALYFSGTVNVYEDDVGIILEQLYDFKPPPQPPLDLKAKKVTMKSVRKKKGEIEEEETEDEIFEEIEDEMINEGLFDIEEEDDYNGDD
jgi:DNA polymerase-3 subunit alpha